MPLLERETKTGEPIFAGDFEITPLSRVLKIQLPGRPTGLIWNRPKAVIIRTTDGQEKILPVDDVTRRTMWAMLAGGLVGAILIGLMYRNR